MFFRRSLLLAWIAAALTALAPVFAYAHIHLGAHGEVVESCALGDEPAPSLALDSAAAPAHAAGHDHGAPEHHATHAHHGLDAQHAQHSHAASGDAPQAPDTHSGKSATPHCIYCPGFTAGATLAAHVFGVPGPSAAAIGSVRVAPAVPDGRPSVRIAQQRGPPSAS